MGIFKSSEVKLHIIEKLFLAMVVMVYSAIALIYGFGAIIKDAPNYITFVSFSSYGLAAIVIYTRILIKGRSNVSKLEKNMGNIRGVFHGFGLPKNSKIDETLDRYLFYSYVALCRYFNVKNISFKEDAILETMRGIAEKLEKDDTISSESAEITFFRFINGDIINFLIRIANTHIISVMPKTEEQSGNILLLDSIVDVVENAVKANKDKQSLYLSVIMTYGFIVPIFEDIVTNTYSDTTKTDNVISVDFVNGVVH